MFLLSAEPFRHAIRVPTHGYASVSMADPPGQEWFSLETALSHVSAVANFGRANSRVPHRLRAQVMEAGKAVRAEWAELSQNRPEIPLANIIGIASHRRAIWPLSSEFAENSARGNKQRWGGNGKSHERSNYLPYENIGKKGDIIHYLERVKGEKRGRVENDPLCFPTNPKYRDTLMVKTGTSI